MGWVLNRIWHLGGSSAFAAFAVIALSGRDAQTRLPYAVDDALLRGTSGELWAVCASISLLDRSELTL